ncbi:MULTISPECIES: gas vesicle protein GvpG [Staphylococcus]|uniref:Gas vesicle protein GvpG n=2 Tax=Staphylococcus simulans TaxID=1286 RepID=A0ABN0PE43_STASI|nr:MULTISPECIES: gas vesicle protein GvpG [Staphylococcus]OHS48490.1 gas vesicle protein GvpG [Staphylococcus sp. HMSC65H10]ATF30917.1 gas vesicle protein GvpG [Staphylococcus simulans]AVO02928.1 gas vesicle protein GvpG [Staphylococcus simulans]AVO05883.1 gas vesicle protein GvpG [Staphylococcus simulans]AWG19476.1 gas vesicle protein GvpG [Staphylococcus simulans]
MIVYGSLKLLKKIAEQVKDEADKELYDLPTIEKKLIQLQMQEELGEIPEDEYKEKEEQLLARYETAKQKEIDEAEAMIQQKEDE